MLHHTASGMFFSCYLVLLLRFDKTVSFTTLLVIRHRLILAVWHGVYGYLLDARILVLWKWILCLHGGRYWKWPQGNISGLNIYTICCP
jgi:hypothetical protein